MSIYVIAEAGCNHNGDLSVARKMVQEAKEAGADAIKFQTYVTDELFGLDKETLEYCEKARLKFGDFQILKYFCKEYDIDFMSTPFDEKSIGWLCSLQVETVKASSLFATDLEFLAKLKNFPNQIVSTGMCCLNDCRKIKEVLPNATLLHCTSAYPAPVEDVNLRAMQALGELGEYGLSDHTLSVEIPLAAAALGASVIEKHFTLDKTMTGPDHAMSLDPYTFTAMVIGIRNIEKAMGNGIKRPMPSESKVIKRKELHGQG